MHIKFLAHGEGSGQKAVDYLLGERDHNGDVRDEVIVSGDLSPQDFADLVDSLSFKKRYSSAVFSFSPEDKPSPEQRHEVEDAFSRSVKKGMGDRVAVLFVWHRHGETWHCHPLVANIDLATGKQYNPAPPGWKKMFDALRDYFNAKYGWKSPDIDAHPENARIVSPSIATLKGLWDGIDSDVEDTRQIVADYIVGQIHEGVITDRESMLDHLKEIGFEIPRAGKNYITIKGDMLASERDNKIRLKGALFHDDFDAERFIERERNGAPDPAARRAERTDPEAAQRFLRKYEKEYAAWVARNEKRYGRLSGRIKNKQSAHQAAGKEEDNKNDLDRADHNHSEPNDQPVSNDVDDEPGRSQNSDKRSGAELHQELQRQAMREDRHHGPAVQRRLARYTDYKQSLTATFFINAVSYRDMRYVDMNKMQILFTDGGRIHIGESRLTATNMSDEAAAERIVHGALADEWKAISFTGSDDFVELAMKKAMKAGIEVKAKDYHQEQILKQLKQDQEKENVRRFTKRRPDAVPGYRAKTKPRFRKGPGLKPARNRLHTLSELALDGDTKPGIKMLLQSDERADLQRGRPEQAGRMRRQMDDGRGLNDEQQQQSDTVRKLAADTIETANNLNQHINDADRKIRERAASDAQRFRDISKRNDTIKSVSDWTYKSVSHQVNAMNCDTFTIGIRDDKTGRFMHKHYTRDQLLNKKTVGYLRLMNAKDNHIYIMPGERENHGLILLDDIDKATIEQMIEDGRNPVLAIETSGKNYQVWLRVGHAVDKKSRLEVSRMLVKEYGADPGSIGSEHFGRLAGLTNRKDEHLTDNGYPFSKIDFDIDRQAVKRDVTPRLYMDLQQAYQRIENEEEKTAKAKRLREELAKKRSPIMPHDRFKLAEENPDEVYFRQYQMLEEQHGNNFDKSRADFMISKDLIGQYAQSEEQVKDIILRCSPDAYERKNNPEYYARRTAEAAHNAVYRERDENKDELKSGPGLMKPKI